MMHPKEELGGVEPHENTWAAFSSPLGEPKSHLPALLWDSFFSQGVLTLVCVFTFCFLLLDAMILNSSA